MSTWLSQLQFSLEQTLRERCKCKRVCWADDPREDGRGVRYCGLSEPKLSPVLHVQYYMCLDMWGKPGALNGLTTGSSPNSVPQIRSLNQELSSSQDQMQFPFIPYQWASVTANISSHESQQASRSLDTIEPASHSPCLVTMFQNAGSVPLCVACSVLPQLRVQVTNSSGDLIYMVRVSGHLHKPRAGIPLSPAK